MALKDMVNYPTTTLTPASSVAHAGGGYGSFSGSYANMHDGDFSTGYTVSCGGGYGDWSASSNMSLTAIFAKAVTLTEIKYRCVIHTGGDHSGGVCNTTASYDIQITYNGTDWVDPGGGTFSAGLSTNGDNDSGNADITGTWTNVLGIRAQMGTSGGGDHAGQESGGIYEIQAYANISGYAAII